MACFSFRSNCEESFEHGDLSIMSSQYESGHQLSEAIFWDIVGGGIIFCREENSLQQGYVYILNRELLKENHGEE